MFDSTVESAESGGLVATGLMSPRRSGAFPTGGLLAFFPSRNRSVAQPRSRSTPVMAVGQRVFVNCPGNRSGSVILGDASGKILSAVHLADGVEVEVIAWRPGWSDARYRVRASADGADGWLPADNLRRALVPLPEPAPPKAQEAPVAETSRRRFGQSV